MPASQARSNSAGAQGSATASWRRLRPGLRGVVVVATAAVIITMSALVANTVAAHVTQTAIDEAVGAATTLVRGNVDDLLTARVIEDPAAAEAQQINDRLARLTSVGHLLRIKVWTPDATIRFSDDPGLRGRRFDLASDLQEALDGEVSSEIAPPDAAENVDEVGLAAELLQIYLPIHDPSTGAVIGSYEVYQDAGPIEVHVDATRSDVLVIVAGASAALLGVLYLAFSWSGRRLARQNRQLLEQAAAQEVLATDLRRSEERFRSLVQNSADVILVTDRGGTIRYESPAIVRVLGYSAAARIGGSVDDLIHPADLPAARQLRLAVLDAPGGQARADLRLRHADGQWRNVEVVAANHTDDPAVNGIVLNYHDVTDRVRLEEQLTHAAFHDPLTGLANRALFRDRVGHALSRARRRRPVGVLFVDLDDFKSVNDVRGHTAGDALLAAVARRIEGAVRTGDTASRLGGDEFGILVEHAASTAVPMQVAQRILAALRQPVEVGDERITIRASVGVALSTPDQTVDELLANADLAMYVAKGAGGDRAALHDPAHQVHAAERLQLRTDLEAALGDRQLFLDFQPIVDLATGEMTGVEALARWRHPARGLIPPTVFIPLAEESGLIGTIGAWVMRTACAEVQRLDGPVGRSLTVAVNVSSRELLSDGFAETVRATLRDTGLDPARLIIEVTESVLIRDMDRAVDTLAALRAAGSRVAIDDFGTGYSSLNYLTNLPVDILKIDRSFVAGIAKGDDGGSLVGSIVTMARSLHLRVIAEGIEQTDQLAALRAVGAEEGQGYLLGYPSPVGDLMAGTALPPHASRRRARPTTAAAGS